MNTINRTWLPGLIAAFMASLCCITSLIAVLGGISGMVSSFAWIEQARPYLIGFTVLVLTVAWYQQLSRKPATKNDCECEVKSTSFWQSKKLLLIVTLVSAVLITFPSYSSVFYGTPKQFFATTMQQSNLKWVKLSVKGMSCADCTKHIDGTLSKIAGVAGVSTSFEKAQTLVSYDSKKTSVDSLKNKINQIGYQVTSIQIQSK